MIVTVIDDNATLDNGAVGRASYLVIEEE